MTGDRQKTDIEGTRRTRNHRPTRKEKQDAMDTEEKKMQNKKNEMHARGSRWIERCRDRCREKIDVDR